MFKIEEVKEMLIDTPHQRLEVVKNQLIATAGEELKGVYYLLKGSVRGEMMDFEGKIIKIEDIESGRLLAPAFLFGKNNHYPVNIVANSSGQLIYIRKDDFLNLLQRDRKVLMIFLNIVATRTQFLTEKIKFLSFSSIKGKYAEYLLTTMQQNGGNLTFRVTKTQEQLADFFGVTRPALGKIISELKQEGIVAVKGKEITILQIEKLKQLLKV